MSLITVVEVYEFILGIISHNHHTLKKTFKANEEGLKHGLLTTFLIRAFA